jgi:hypothetical protein
VVLSNIEAKELIKHPYSALHIQRARYQESRLRFHAQVAEHRTYSSRYLIDFSNWAKNVITATDKYAQFDRMLTYPLKSNEVVDSIADEYAKVFNSQNAFIGYEFTDPALKQEYTEYSKGYEHFWRKDVFSAMLSAINSIVVIDMPVFQEEVKPYYYLLSIDRVLDVRTDKDGKIEYLIFRDGEYGEWDRIVVVDDESYRVYNCKDDKQILKSTAPHILGYVPCAFMWNDSLSMDTPIVKQSPISTLLSDLDWYLFHYTSKKCFDIYGSFPIYWHYANKCTVKECDGGFIRMPNSTIVGGFFMEPCPVCAHNSLVGAGSVLKVDPPRGPDSPNLREPAGIIAVEKSSLEWNVTETERLKDEIIRGATGKLTEKSRTTGAMNEDQVHSNYESQTNILIWIASNFEKIHKFVIDTTATLMYGERFVGSTVSYGSEFYLQDQATVTDEYLNAKNAGLPMYILQAKRNQVDELQSKNNPQERQRLYILRQLEPYQDISMTDLQTIPSLDANKFVIKLNFSTFVNQFEIEYGNIVEWGSALDLKTKIDRINLIFNQYVAEQKPIPTAAQSPTGSQ